MSQRKVPRGATDRNLTDVQEQTKQNIVGTLDRADDRPLHRNATPRLHVFVTLVVPRCWRIIPLDRVARAPQDRQSDGNHKTVKTVRRNTYLN